MGFFDNGGGVEVVTVVLLKQDLPFWGIIGMVQTKEKLVVRLSNHIEFCVEEDIEKIIQILKRNQITHIVIQLFDFVQSQHE